ncbi:hypothetical protein D3C76_923500 [compost metagenome]
MGSLMSLRLCARRPYCAPLQSRLNGRSSVALRVGDNGVSSPDVNQYLAHLSLFQFAFRVLVDGAAPYVADTVSLQSASLD